MKVNNILTETQIAQKLKRMAYEIWEQNSAAKEIVLLGIAQGGAVIASNLYQLLSEISPLKLSLSTLHIDKKNVIAYQEELSVNINNKTVVVVDDVANSGKTLMYAIRPLLNHNPKKMQIAVLVDRQHKNFPITADFIGYSVATTLQEHIEVSIENDKVSGAFLK